MRQLSFAALLTILLAALPAAATDVWVETPGTMILADRPAGTVKAINQSGVRNEYVTAQIALRGETPADKPLSFEWSDLAGGAKAIAKSNIMLYRAADIEVYKGIKDMELISEEKDKARARKLGMFPDALVPLVKADGTNVANTISLEKDTTAAFWVDIFIPAGTPAGDYAGTITLKQGGGQVAQVPVKVKVFDAEIPAENTIPSIYSLRLHPQVVANTEAYVSEVMRHRIQPTNSHYADAWESRHAVLEKFNPDNKGFVAIFCQETEKLTPERAQRVIKELKTVTESLKQRGLMDRSFLHLKDEPKPDSFPGMIDIAQQILKEMPEWKGKIADTLNKEGSDLDQIVTHHIHALKCYGDWYYPKGYAGREEWDKRRADGRQIWFYVSNAQGVPFPTYDIHTVNVAFEPRVLGWAFWYEKAYGHLYWSLMDNATWKLGKGFPPGDGQLMYPGDFTLPGAPTWVQIKDLKAPVVSRRLKLQREGMEEWEMLRLAEKKVGRERVQAIVSNVYHSLGEGGGKYKPDSPPWSYEEAKWDEARLKLINLLLAK